jgi:hypothetical protein
MHINKTAIVEAHNRPMKSVIIPAVEAQFARQNVVRFLFHDSELAEARQWVSR